MEQYIYILFHNIFKYIYKHFIKYLNTFWKIIFTTLLFNSKIMDDDKSIIMCKTNNDS